MSHRLPRSSRVVRAALVLATLLFAPAAWADLTPENVLLVVNGDSVASRTVANHYLAVRGAAGVTVVTLRDLPDWEETTVDVFRERILLAALSAADARGLAPQVEAIVYSTAIPTKIKVSGDLADEVFGEGQKPGKYFTPFGSLTGLTTLYEPVLQKRAAEYLAPNANAAFVAPVKEEAGDAEGDAEGELLAPPTTGFRRAIGFDAQRKPTTGVGRRYLLSAVLGVTTGRGETVDGVIARLRTTAAADGTAPAGEIVFCDTGNVRSTTRKPLFALAVASIKAEAADRELDVWAEIVPRNLPQWSRNMFGLTAGLPGVTPKAWEDTHSAFVPGAFADNLTSFGAVLSERVHGQVTAVDWLRYGASASGGTVHEPYALAFKFPTPFVHLHRLRGVTLGEAILRSVAGPYQYLTVGDPLSNPYARRPTVTLELGGAPGRQGSGATALLSGVVPVTLAAADEEGNPVQLAGWELYADGKRFAVLPPDGTFDWNTADRPDGGQTFTAVAVAADDAHSRGRAVRLATIGNERRRAIASASVEEVAWGEPLTVSVAASGFGAEARRFTLRHGTDEAGAGELALGDGNDLAMRGEATIDTRSLGLGPVTLRAEVVAVTETGEPGDLLAAAPLEVTIVPPPNRTPMVGGDVKLLDGPALRWAGGEPVPLSDGLRGGWLKGSGIPAETNFTLVGVVTTTEPGLHRLALRTNCGGTVLVDGEPAPPLTDATESSAAGKAWRSVPVWLKPGRHAITLTGRTPAANPIFDVRWGRAGLATPTAETWRRPPE